MNRRTLLPVALCALLVGAGAWLTRDLDPDGGGGGEVYASAPLAGEPPRREVELAVGPGAPPRPAADPVPEVAPDPAPEADPGARTALEPTRRRAVPARVAVHVTGPGGAPVPGVPVTAYYVNAADGEARATRSAGGSHGSLYLVPRTDEAGRAELELPPGRRLRLSVQGSPIGAESRSLSLGRLEPGELRALTVELAAGQSVPYHGRVVDAAGGGAVPGVRVWRHATGERAAAEPDLWDTAAAPEAGGSPAGTFVVQRPLWTTDALLVAAPGRVPATLLMDHDHGDPDAPRTVVLHPGATLAVTLTDAGGRPAAGVELGLRGGLRHLAQSEAEALHGRSFLWSARSDEDGRLRLDGLPPDAALELVPLAGELPAGLPPRVTLRRGEVRELEGTVPEGVLLALAVRGPDGEPLAAEDRPELWLVRADGRGPTLLGAAHEPRVERRVPAGAADDALDLASVPAGAWWLGPAPGGAWAPRGRWFEVGEDPGRVPLDLELEPARALGGRVLDAEGIPRADVAVVVRPWGSGEELRTESDGSGAFVLGGLPAGLYEVRALPDGDVPGGAHAGSAARSVRVGPGEPEADGEPTVELVLREGGCLRGVAVDGEGRVHDAFRQVLWTDDTGRVRARTGGDADLELTGQDERLLDLCAVTEDGRVGVLRGLRAAPGEPPVEFVLELGAGGDLWIEPPSAEAADFRVFQGTTCVAAGHLAARPVPEVDAAAAPEDADDAGEPGGDDAPSARAHRVRVPPGELRVVFPELGLGGPARREADGTARWSVDG